MCKQKLIEKYWTKSKDPADKDQSLPTWNYQANVIKIELNPICRLCKQKLIEKYWTKSKDPADKDQSLPTWDYQANVIKIELNPICRLCKQKPKVIDPLVSGSKY